MAAANLKGCLYACPSTLALNIAIATLWASLRGQGPKALSHEICVTKKVFSGNPFPCAMDPPMTKAGFDVARMKAKSVLEQQRLA